MQISENLLRVIFLLSTIVAVTDCCSSRLLLLKEHTLQIVQNRLHNINNDESDYDQYDDYDQQQQQQQQLLEQKQQQQKIPQYLGIINGDMKFNKSPADEHKSAREDNEDEMNNTDRNILASGALQLGELRMDEFESLLGIFDAAAFESTMTTTTTATPSTTTTAATTMPSTITTATTATTARSETTSTTAKTTVTPTAKSETAESINTTTIIAAEVATTTAATPTTTTAEITTKISQTTDPSATSEAVESNTEKVNTTAAQFNLASTSSTTAKTAAAAAKIGSEVASVMNDLKSVRDLLSLPCSGQFNTEFCLNRGRCFRYPIGNDTIHSCICADGYIGERCESKSMNGSFVPSIAGAHKKKIVMARIVFSFPMLVALSVIYIMIGAAVVFKRPPAHSPLPEPSLSADAPAPSSTSPTSAPLSSKETFELWAGDDETGEYIMLNSYPIAVQAATAAASYATYTD